MLQLNESSNERWVSTKEIDQHFVNKETIHKWNRNDSIPCHRVGKLWRFKISEIDAWVEKGMASNLHNKK